MESRPSYFFFPLVFVVEEAEGRGGKAEQGEEIRKKQHEMRAKRRETTETSRVLPQCHAVLSLSFQKEDVRK